MSREQGRRAAAGLLIVTSAIWVHEWFPALLAAAFVAWVLLHNRLEGELGNDLLRLWRRRWPPSTLVLVPLLVAGAVAYWVSGLPVTTKILPIALNLFALSMIVFGSWWRWFRPIGSVSPETARASNRAS